MNPPEREHHCFMLQSSCTRILMISSLVSPHVTLVHLNTWSTWLPGHTRSACTSPYDIYNLHPPSHRLSNNHPNSYQQLQNLCESPSPILTIQRMYQRTLAHKHKQQDHASHVNSKATLREQSRPEHSFSQKVHNHHLNHKH